MRVVLFGAAAAVALVLAACGGHPSAVAPQGQEAAANAPAPGPSYGPSRDQGSSSSYDARNAPVPQVDGKPLWAANKKHTAEENAQYQFQKNGRDFAASSEDDYVAKAHAFVAHPPSGAQTLQRSNGDRLIYDPASNVFAVASKDGAPRTMFKPRDGAAYWTQQKDRESKRASGGEREDG
jgi:pyocin large subunit-like protein